VGGADVSSEAVRVRQRIGVVPQRPNPDRSLNVIENLLFHAAYFGIHASASLPRANELLEQLGIADKARAKVDEMSGGQQQRLMIARALIHEPRVIFLDEPTVGLDPQTRLSLWEILRALHGEGRTIVMTTHYMEEADKLCDRIAIVDHGKLMALDSPLKLKSSIPGKNVLEASFAEPPADWERTLTALPGVESVAGHDNIYRISSTNGPATTMALMAAADRAGVPVQSLAVQSTSLDDVFVHYTGRALRDALQEPSAQDSPFMIRRG
jgi:ABC-2 type transport system ATP-binding protein